MAKYFQGYSEAQAGIQKMSKEELLSYLDSMYGREKLESESVEDLHQEAQRQCTLDFADTSVPEYDLNYRWAQDIITERKSYTEI